ncbi:50S ribosomal protein L4 [Candidatus Nitrosacidococcus tergens]|uniref:Large ribosomal subunit protein uL4 n=1 Tax=Candidatus Nitrosacidococcus tergens TaxID=553981 RepID=A0A7G1Q870_9GAMM|nr:50S ribosomal protein L4 [Candidatus Nitrosacidococcus tergens]CAB1274809.1 50S ribosomal subunit protein L4 [Candidatus Nitrosacidococcus tergens]
MDFAVQNSIGGPDQSTIRISDSVFSNEFNEALVSQTILTYLVRSHSGTKAQKTRSEVRGGGIKPFRQKGTGRARAGTIRSPLWRGGGKVFAAQPRDYTQKLNKKMYKGAMCSIFSELVRQDRLRAVNDECISLPGIKTKHLVNLLAPLNWDTLLIIISENDRNLELSARNIPTVNICNVKEINPYSLVKSNGVLSTYSALRCIERNFS